MKLWGGWPAALGAVAHPPSFLQQPYVCHANTPASCQTWPQMPKFEPGKNKKSLLQQWWHPFSKRSSFLSDVAELCFDSLTRTLRLGVQIPAPKTVARVECQGIPNPSPWWSCRQRGHCTVHVWNQIPSPSNPKTRTGNLLATAEYLLKSARRV